MKQLSVLLVLVIVLSCQALHLTRLSYGGGGDWYNDQEALPNLAEQIMERTGIEMEPDQVVVSAEDQELFEQPFLFLTGHGKIRFSELETGRLRRYLENGGFIYADDDYGMDTSFREQIKAILPGRELQPLPGNHLVYSIFYEMEGLPKVHEHDDKPPQAFGIFHNGRMVVLYTHEANISDGWADADRYGDPEDVREQAFRMGVNIFLYALCGHE